ncbi:MAG: EMC3/TMCO1 family protein [Candidatus Diapherotrites archaeon]
MVFLSPQFDIAVITFVLAIVSQILRRVLMNPSEMKVQQAAMKEKQGKMKELMNKNDHKSAKELEKMQKEMMESMGAMMSGSMKLMFVSMLIFLPIFWFLGSTYADVTISLPIPIPWFGGDLLIMLYNETNFYGWYILTSLFFSIILNVVIGQVEKMLKGEVNASAQ